MRRELSVVFQFILILLLVGCGYFGLLLLQNKTTLLLWGEYQQFILYWIFAFTTLSLFRLFALYVFSIKRTGGCIQSDNEVLFRKEGVSKTIQYFVIGVISALASFWIFALQLGLMVNISELWLDFRHIFFSWLVGFFILSSLRLGIFRLYLRNL
jgi:hypothetical protein